MRPKRRREVDFVSKDIRRTMLKVHVLWRANSGDANAYALIKEFSTDKTVSPFYPDKRELKDDVYNATRSLEKAGLLVSSQRIERGRLKQYFALTREGEKVLESSIAEFMEGAKGISALFRK